MDIRKLLVIIALPLCLNGCVGAAIVAGAGIGATGGTMAYDRRSFHQQFSDRRISDEAKDTIINDATLSGRAHISVATYSGVVLLVGQTQTPELKQHVQDVVKQIKGVKKIYNEIQISGSESLFASVDDAWLTSKVKTMLIRRADLNSGQIKVVTENGVVYLMGNVSHEQANLAADATRRVGGVRKVVEVFQQHS